MTPLRRRMVEDMRIRNLALNTQRMYLQYVSMLAKHFGKSPEQLEPEHVRAFLMHLINERRLRASSIGVAASALRFLCKRPGNTC